MTSASRTGFMGAAIAVVLIFMIGGCGDDQVRVLKTAAELRQQIESALGRIEADNQVPGLGHRHITVEPDSSSGGFAIKVYDVNLGNATIGFQAFREVTFVLVRKDATRFVAEDFNFVPRPVTDGPKSAADALVEKLKAVMSGIEAAD